LAGALVVLLVGGMVAAGTLLAATPNISDAEQRAWVIDSTHGVFPTVVAAPRFVDALVATEDSRFYAHHGIDFVGVARAGWASITGSSAAGGATLDQQLAKQLYFGGVRGGTATLKQIALGFKLDANYTKQQILQMYASVVYFGNGYYGLDAASRGYFGVSPNQLSWGQAALLAGLMQAPSAYNPVTHPAKASARERHVLDRLVATGQLSSQEAASAADTPLSVLARKSHSPPHNRRAHSLT